MSGYVVEAVLEKILVIGDVLPTNFDQIFTFLLFVGFLILASFGFLGLFLAFFVRDILKIRVYVLII